MSKLPYANLLSKIEGYAKKIGDKPDAPFTAERFLVVVIGMADGSVALEEPDEFAPVKRLLEKANLKLNSLKELLIENINNSESEFFEDVYMHSILSRADEYALEKGESSITPELVLDIILKKPSNRIVRYFEESASGNHQSGASSTADRPIFPSNQGQSRKSEQQGADRTLTREGAGDASRQDSQAVGGDDNAMIPKEEIERLTKKVKEMQDVFSENVLGQANAVNVTTTGYFQAEILKMTQPNRNKPRATFVFAGPPGVGKTLLAEQFASELGNLPFRRFDMSEFADKEANIRFAGSDQVYRDSQSGVVTDYVMKHPKSVLLFDEIEKAHLVVLRLFYQILDAGTLMDAKTNTLVSFKDTYIIFTTNAGKQFYEEAENGDFSAVSRKVILKAIQQDSNPVTKEPFFPAALVSRFAQGNVVMFNHMSAHVLHQIVEKQVGKRIAEFEKKFGIKTEIDDNVYTAIMFSEGGNADARTIVGRANSFFDNEFYELVRLTSSELTKTGIRDIENIKIGVSLPEDPDIVKMFKPLGTPEMLLFSSKEVADKYAGKTDACVFTHCDNADEAKKCLRKRDIKAVIIDINYGKKHDLDYLNIEDAVSEARDFFFYAHENFNGIPIYFIETGEHDFDREEIVSFMRKGVKGIIDGSDKNDVFAKEISDLCLKLHHQQNMVDLARSNKLVTYETAQRLSADGKTAEILLFDFKLGVALDPDDSDDILSNMSRPTTTFDDVIGANSAQEELKYFISYLKDPRSHIGSGEKAPKGILLYGPPGTGKTLLAKAMANASNSTFISMEGNSLMSNGSGDGSEKIHRLFRKARKYAPTIVFIDEIDAIAKERTGYGGANEAVLTALLTEMDGFKVDSARPVFVLAATNFDVTPGSPKSLDGALMRRFDRTLYIGLPGREDRKRYLLMLCSKNAENCDISEETIDNIAIRSTGMSLALLENVFNLALRMTRIRGSARITDEILGEAFESFNNGEKREWDPAHLERTARHEAGHAFMCWYGGETPSYLTIVARADHGGYMQHGDNEKKGTYSKKDLISLIRTSLAGRGAEIVYYGSVDGITTGASGDLGSATRVAQAMICSYGMDDEFGLSVVNSDAALSGELSAEVREKVNALLSAELKSVINILTENKSALDALVEKLMQQSYMTGDDIEKVLEGVARP